MSQIFTCLVPFQRSGFASSDSRNVPK
jgi:hypothetical protein